MTAPTSPSVRWLLEHPLDYAEGAIAPEYRSVSRQPDGALLTVVLAVDR